MKTQQRQKHLGSKAALARESVRISKGSTATKRSLKYQAFFFCLYTVMILASISPPWTEAGITQVFAEETETGAVTGLTERAGGGAWFHLIRFDSDFATENHGKDDWMLVFDENKNHRIEIFLRNWLMGRRQNYSQDDSQVYNQEDSQDDNQNDNGFVEPFLMVERRALPEKLHLSEAYQDRRVTLKGSFQQVLVTADLLHLTIHQTSVIQHLLIDESLKELALFIHPDAKVEQLAYLPLLNERGELVIPEEYNISTEATVGSDRYRSSRSSHRRESDADPAPDTGVDPTPIPDPDTEPDVEPEPEPDIEPEPDPDPEPAPDTDTDLDTDPEPDPDPVPVETFLVEAMTIGSGSVTGTGSFAQGEEITLIALAEPGSGFAFCYWELNDGTLTEPLEDEWEQRETLNLIMPGEGISLTAHFVLASPFGGGLGTIESPYLLNEPVHLAMLMALTQPENHAFVLETFGGPGKEDFKTSYLDAHYRMTQNLNLEGFDHDSGYVFSNSSDESFEKFDKPKLWRPIGNDNHPFNGSFDGGNHRITGLTIDGGNRKKVGFFALIGEEGQVTNLTLTDPDIKGEGHVGGLAGVNQGNLHRVQVLGTNLDAALRRIENIDTGISVMTASGGLVGVNQEGGDIHRCRVSYRIKAAGRHTGMLAGINSGEINASLASGIIENSLSKQGGLVGYNIGGSVANSYTEVTLGGTEFTRGGLIGYIEVGENGDCDVTKSYGYSDPGASIDSAKRVGLLAGNRSSSAPELIYCYYFEEMVRDNYNTFGTKISEVDRNQESFIGFDFDDIWVWDIDLKRPRLRWESNTD